MKYYFRPYDGKNPYLFVSYSHADSDAAIAAASRLNEERFRVWYDEGIPAGDDWPSSVEAHLRACGRVLFFRSVNSLASENCFSEISTASALQIPITVIPLDGTETDARWTEALKNASILEEKDVESVLTEQFRFRQGESTGNSGGKTERNVWIVLAILSAIILLGTAAAAFGLQRGWFPNLIPEKPSPAPATAAPTSEPVDTEQWSQIFKSDSSVLFPDREQEEAIRLMLDGKEEILYEDLREVKELFFCGSMALDTDADITCSSGEYRVRTASPAAGDVKDLSLISQMLNLKKLVLVNQKITNISKLQDLPLLRELNVAGCPMETLEGLSGFPALEVLHLEHTNIKNLEPLHSFPALRTVTVSLDMLPLEPDSFAEYEVILAE